MITYTLAFLQFSSTVTDMILPLPLGRHLWRMMKSMLCLRMTKQMLRKWKWMKLTQAKVFSSHWCFGLFPDNQQPKMTFLLTTYNYFRL